MATDREALNWWAICLFRRTLYLQVVSETPVTTGSTGQLVAHPLENTIRALTSDINRTADRFGMDPLARFRLHFETEAGRPTTAAAWAGIADDDEPEDPRYLLQGS